MADPTSTSTRVFQAFGIVASAFVGGGMFSLSWVALTALLEAPSPILLRQWKIAYERGKATYPVIGIASGLSFTYLAYSISKLPIAVRQPKLALYTAAAISATAIIPYTVLLMSKTNGKLLQKADETKALGKTDELTEAGMPEGESVKELVDWWGVLNLIRSIPPIFASSLGLWAALS